MATLDDVYHKFGMTAEAAQLLETELGTILIVQGVIDANLLNESNPEVAALIFNKINRQTLGQLVKKLHQSVTESEKLESLLIKALEDRNKLSHSFYRKHNFRRNSEEGCAIMLNDLESIHCNLMDAYKAVMLLSGIDLDKIALSAFPTKHVPI